MGNQVVFLIFSLFLYESDSEVLKFNLHVFLLFMLNICRFIHSKQTMNFHHLYTHHYYGPMFLVAPQCEDLTPSHGPPAVTILMENIIKPQDKVLEYHHYYGSTPAFLASPWHWYYPYLCTHPLLNLPENRPPQGNPPDLQDGTWPEGFSMRGELRWGKLERVFGVSRELPDFVKEDLRRVYGTYPSTAVSVSYYRGEFVVRGDPRVGEQEYRVEKKVVRKVPHDGENVGEIEKKKSKKEK